MSYLFEWAFATGVAECQPPSRCFLPGHKEAGMHRFRHVMTKEMQRHYLSVHAVFVVVALEEGSSSYRLTSRTVELATGRDGPSLLLRRCLSSHGARALPLQWGAAVFALVHAPYVGAAAMEATYALQDSGATHCPFLSQSVGRQIGKREGKERGLPGVPAGSCK